MTRVLAADCGLNKRRLIMQLTANSTRLSTETKNAVLSRMAELLDAKREAIIAHNREEVEAYTGNDQSMRDRLKVNDKKVDGMIKSLHDVRAGADPVGAIRYAHMREDSLKIENKSVPFGNILIIYESRPDVTIEAASLAFKAGNKILLKGGKEARKSNLFLVNIWHQALREMGVSTDWITYLNFNRSETQEYLKNRNCPADLIVPRGGERLIEFVREHARVPVIVSGRGNNFLYVHTDADCEATLNVIVNAKTQKISACNSLDKVLINSYLPFKEAYLKEIIGTLREKGVEILADAAISALTDLPVFENEAVWKEEFLAPKMLLAQVNSMPDAIRLINQHSGGHSATIMTKNDDIAEQFMNDTDTAHVFHNASTRFADGGQLGLGAELGISTEKLHHRGALGLEQLMTNKWFIYGNGHVRK